MRSLAEKDYGTPATLDTPARVTLQIDGRTVSVVRGSSLLRTALENGIELPHLCASDLLKPTGACRLCLVEVEGRNGFPASCTTPAEDGMKVHTEAPELATLRRNIVELYLSDHKLEVTRSGCELESLAERLGISGSRYSQPEIERDVRKADCSNPYFVFDPSQCILCSRCIRACEDIQGTFAIGFQGRGDATSVAAGQAETFATSDCVSCGACVQVCPTEALIEKSAIGQGTPDRSVVTTCGYCGVGCALRVETRDGEIIRIVPDAGGRANHGHACVKGRFAWSFANHPDRVARPLIRDCIDKPWREVTWSEAIAFAAEGLKRALDRYGSKAVGAIASARCSNEEVYLVQKLAHSALQTNNIDNCARECHSPSGYGLKQAFGASAATNDFDSVEAADVIMIVGANSTEAHPVFGSRVKRRVRAGAKLIVIDPRVVEIARAPHVEALYHLQPQPGSNVALLNAIAHVVMTENLADEGFIAEECDWVEFERWRGFVSQESNSPEAVRPVTGVDAAMVRAVAREFAGAANAAIYYGLGVTEHQQGSTAVMALANLTMATGNIGRPGTGLNPMRGQNNVQGACDMGAYPNELPGNRPINDESVRVQFEVGWGVRLDPKPGMRMPEMWEAARNGAFKAIYIQGEDVAQSEPQVERVAQALRAMDFVVVQDLFLNETSKYAHVFLPAASFLEKDGTFTNAERRVSRVRKAIEPVSGKADWQITSALSTALGYPMAYENPSEIMDEIARLTPTFSGVSYDLLERLGGVQWPCNAQAPEGTPILHREKFTRGKGRFTITEFLPTPEKADAEFPLILITGRTLSQYNAGTQTRRTANAGMHSQDVLEINPSDAGPRGIANQQMVEVKSRNGAIHLRARLSENVQPGVVYTTFHHPESRVNELIGDVQDWATGCPQYKVTAVQVRNGRENVRG